MDTKEQARKIDIYTKVSLVAFVLFIVRSFYVLFRLSTLDAREIDHNIAQELKLMAVTAAVCGALAFFARYRAVKLSNALQQKVETRMDSL